MYNYFYTCYLGSYWVDAMVLGWDPISIEFFDPCLKQYVTVSGIDRSELKFKKFEENVED